MGVPVAALPPESRRSRCRTSRSESMIWSSQQHPRTRGRSALIRRPINQKRTSRLEPNARELVAVEGAPTSQDERTIPLLTRIGQSMKQMLIPNRHLYFACEAELRNENGS